MARKQAGGENRQKLGRRQAELLKGLCLVQKQWIHSSTSRAWRSENKQVKHTEKGKAEREAQFKVRERHFDSLFGGLL